MVFSIEASIANDNRSNEESTLPIVAPQAMEELKTGLVPQAQTQLVVVLFVDQRVFINALQYH